MNWGEPHCLLLELLEPQQQAVGDDREAACGHGRRRHAGRHTEASVRDKDSGCRRNQKDVIEKRPRQVLANGSQRHSREPDGFHDGEQMGGASPVAVPNVQPGETVDVSVDLVAPAETGNYTGKWRLFAADGTPMMTITVVIAVASTEPIPAGQEGVEIQTVAPDGTTRTWTMPCGSPIPPGAVCVCNCVAVPVPGDVGEVPAGETGINFTGPGGETR